MKQQNDKTSFLAGLRDGVPIGLGYFAVAFTLGITAGKAGMNALQSSLMSALMLASAGEFAAISMIQRIVPAGTAEPAASSPHFHVLCGDR